jgi:hypothetical protein
MVFQRAAANPERGGEGQRTVARLERNRFRLNRLALELFGGA